MFYAFDIETMPIRSKIDTLPPVEVKLGNLKDPEKIAEKEREAKAEQIGKMALNPLYGRICAAVFCSPGRTGEIESYRLSADDDDEQERALILSCFAVLSLDTCRLVTWNGNSFDLPFLFKRAMLLDVPLNGVPVLSQWIKRYGCDRHYDLMQIWSNFSGRDYEKLDNVARVLLDNDHKIEIDFREFPELVKTEDGKKRLLDYCEQDVALTYRIFKKFNGYLF